MEGEENEGENEEETEGGACSNGKMGNLRSGSNYYFCHFSIFSVLLYILISTYISSSI